MRMIARSEGWLASDVGDEVMMMHIDRGVYVGLNAMGAEIWRRIETPHAIGDLCAALVTAFEVDAETCRIEVEAFIDKMSARGLVRVAEG